MLKTLLKKQMLELHQSFFQNKKTGKAKTQKAAMASIIFFTLLMVFVIGGIFVALSMMLRPLIEMQLGWLYFLLMSGMTIILGVFGSVFNTYASLYQAKDNEQLLSLPIPTHYILIVRLVSVYLMGLMYSAVVYVPALIVYYITVELSMSRVLCPLLFGIILSVVVLILSCFLGWVVAKVSAKVKNKSFVTVVLSLAFIVLYYVVYFRATEMINELLANALTTGESIREKAFLLYEIGQAAAEEWLPLLVVAIVTMAVLALLCYGMSRSFLSIVTASEKGAKKKYKKGKMSQKSLRAALFSKELTSFLARPNYILNCSLATLLLVAAGVVILVKSDVVMQAMTAITEDNSSLAVGMMVIAICTLVCMNDITAPSISLEGKNMWLLQSLPVTPWQVLSSKIALHMVLTSIPALFCSICVAVAIKPNLSGWLWIVIIPQAFAWLTALIGLTINLLRPNLNWTNEIVVIKQSLGVFVAMFGDWVLILLLGLGYVGLKEYISIEAYLWMSVALLVILCVGLHFNLKKWGTKRFVSL